jgi:DNA-binding IclR family transcriptional regulator
MDGYDVVHIDKVDSPESYGISSRIGSRGVPHLTSLGKALLAAETDAVVDEYIQRMTSSHNPHHIGDPEKVRSEIRATRARGYSVDNEEDSIGVRCLGVAIHGPENKPIFAISVTGPSPRFTLERLSSCVAEVTSTARELSLQFGWKPVSGPTPHQVIEGCDSHQR